MRGDYRDFPVGFEVEIPEPVAPADVPGGTPVIKAGRRRVVVRRMWPTQGIDPQGAIRSGDVWYGLEGPDGTEIEWVREAHTRPVSADSTSA